MPLPELAEWGRKHLEIQKIATPTLNKLLGGVQTIALWARDKGMVPEDLPWSDPFSRMRLKEDPSDRDAFTLTELNLLFAASVFTKGERPTPGRGAPPGSSGGEGPRGTGGLRDKQEGQRRAAAGQGMRCGDFSEPEKEQDED